ncbi:MAG: helix-turn-helix domain-containing protein, partial [Bacilli bacterium]|nr:helix-turn-helix domain-containing protein [Bacilli bacterium]
MSYSHFTIEERISIKHLLAQDVSIRQIAKALDRSPSSVSREIKRNHFNRTLYGGTNYSVIFADRQYKKRISKAHNIVQFPLEVIQIIEQRIKETWSPEQIAAFYKNQGFPCCKTIYKWINEGTIIHGNKKLLRRKGKGGWYETRGKQNRGKSIRKR